MNLEDYEKNRRGDYEDVAETVAAILTAVRPRSSFQPSSNAIFPKLLPAIEQAPLLHSKLIL
jgi:hypothetical protein